MLYEQEKHTHPYTQALYVIAYNWNEYRMHSMLRCNKDFTEEKNADRNIWGKSLEGAMG